MESEERYFLAAKKIPKVVVRVGRRTKYGEGFLGLGILFYWVRELVKWGLCG
jgi:hypothetical protein